MRKTRTAWSQDDKRYLMENYGKKSIKTLMSVLNRPEISIRTKANMLNLYSEKNINEKTIIKIKKILINYRELCYKYKTNIEIAAVLGVGVDFLYRIKKTYKININPIKSKFRARWTRYEINKLKALYMSHTTRECAFNLNRTFEAVKTKLKQHKIRK